jgi:hypothetical protein
MFTISNSKEDIQFHNKKTKSQTKLGPNTIKCLKNKVKAFTYLRFYAQFIKKMNRNKKVNW